MDAETTPEPARRAWVVALLWRRPKLLDRFQSTYAQLLALPRNVRRRLWRGLATRATWAALLVALSASPLLTPRAYAAAITVGGTCSLVDAIKSANSDASVGTCTAGSGADTISLTGDVTLTASAGNFAGSATGLPPVTTAITIDGNGFTIARDPAAPDLRLLAVSNTGNLTLEDVTLSGGRSQSSGGAIDNAGSLTLTDVTVSGNDAPIGNGGGINSNGALIIDHSTVSGNHSRFRGGGVYLQGSLTVVNSTISHNSALWTGGGVEALRYAQVTITDSTISYNTSAMDGGGVLADRSESLTVTNSTISHNRAGARGGGLIAASTPMNVAGSTIGYNMAGDDGGGIYTVGAATVTLTGSTLSHNISSDRGGGLFAGLYSAVTAANSTLSNNMASAVGGGIFAQGAVTLDESAVSDNFSNVQGGGIFADIATTTLNNSTVSDNLTNGSGGGLSVNSDGVAILNGSTVSGNAAFLTGGGIHVFRYAEATLTNSTVSSNSSDWKGGGITTREFAVTTLNETTITGNTAPDIGGGVYGYRGSQNTFNHSIVSGNTAESGAEVFMDNALGVAGFADNDNVFGHDGLTTADAFVDLTIGPSDVLATAGSATPTPLASILDPHLADNGGPTLTHKLVAGSPAIDLSGSGPATDQRGAPRPFGVGFDAGAVEFGATPPVTTGTIVIVKQATPEDNTPFDFTDTIEGSGFTLSDPAGDSITFNDVAPGSFTVTETATPGWSLDDIECDDDNSTENEATATATIALEAGETVTCTFSNSELPPPAVEVFASTSVAGVTGDAVPFGPSDILRWDGSAWSKWFDGAAAGLTVGGKSQHNINAIWIPDLAGDDLYATFAHNSRFVPNIAGKVDGMDIVWWDGDSFALWFDGQDVGLTNMNQEKIDGLHVLDGSESPVGASCIAYLLISTHGPGQVPGPGKPIKFSGEDVLGFCMNSSGANTTGVWHLLLDGSAQGMPRNVTTGLSASDDGETIYLTTRGSFNVDAAHGGHSSVYVYDVNNGAFSGPVFVAPDEGLGAFVDAIQY